MGFFSSLFGKGSTEPESEKELFQKGAKAVTDIDCPKCKHNWLAGFKKSGAPTKVTCPKCGWTGTMAINF